MLGFIFELMNTSMSFIKKEKTLISFQVRMTSLTLLRFVLVLLFRTQKKSNKVSKENSKSQVIINCVLQKCDQAR